MLDITCDHCGRVLIGPRRIVATTATEEGLRVSYVCWCGRPGRLLTGRRRRAPRPATRRPAPVS